MKTEVSTPSRSTAKKAIATSAHEPLAAAVAALARRSPARVLACFRIHTIMKVTMPTATVATTVSSCSCWRCGSAWSSTCRPTARAMQRATARATPAHIARSAVRLPCWRRKAPMMPTINEASTPSRNPITNVGSTVFLAFRRPSKAPLS